MNEDVSSVKNMHENANANQQDQHLKLDQYLKKHKLDVTLLPNKKIKLSDLTSANNMNSFNSLNSTRNPQQEQYEIVTNATVCLNDANDHEYEGEFQFNDEYLHHREEGNEEEEDDDDDEDYENEEYRDEQVEDDEYYEDEEDEIDEFINESLSNLNTTTTTTATDSDSTACKVLKSRNKLIRRKREPSLKLIQKLNSNDLQLIVNCVKSRQAHVFIADVKKDNYVDKILKVILVNEKLSNGSNEALLKKSMFPKDLNMLFDSFVRALCTERTLIENSIEKQGLLCQVIDCNFYSFSEAEIIRHIKRHLAQDGYTCDKCGNQFASMTNLQRHLRIHSGDFGKEIKCPHCDYKASTSTHVKRHMAHKHLERSLPCPHCTFMGATNAELKIHMARKHLELTGKNPLFLPKYLKKDYQCAVCKKQYNDFKEYQAHMYEHTSTLNRFQCSVCPYNCKNYSKLKRHMLYHSGARNYECSICGNKFFQMEHLKRHMQSIHHQEIKTETKSPSSPEKRARSILPPPPPPPPQSTQQIAPPLAPLPTTTSKIHITQTSDEQSTSILQDTQHGLSYKVISKCSYKCQQCDFTTIKLYSLNEHVLYEHDCVTNAYCNENEFSCGFCSYKTDKKTNLKRHLQNNHSSQLTVPICLSNDSLMTHPNTRFQCGLCRRYHVNINDFVKHLTDKHKLPVYILDSSSTNNTDNSLQEQLKTHGRAQLICTSQQDMDDDTSNLIQIIERHPQHQQQQANTVRINPHLNHLLQKQRNRVQIPKQRQPTQIKYINHHHHHHPHENHTLQNQETQVIQSIIDEETDQAIYHISNELHNNNNNNQEQECSSKLIQMMF